MTDLTDIRFNMPFSKTAVDQMRLAANTRISSFIQTRLDLRGKNILAFRDRGGCDCAFDIERHYDGFRLGVHIIDADEFVCKDTPLDQEAAARFTMCRIGDTLHTILPQKLIDSTLSFVEGEDRLAVSVIMTVDENGKLLDIDLQQSVVRASVICDYAEIDAFYTGTDRSELIWILEKYAAFKNEIEMMYDLGARLHAARRRAGAAEYSAFETVTTHDKSGNVASVERKERESDTDRLITEFLLYAGCMTARLFNSHSVPTFFTRSDPMSAEKLQYLSNLCGFTPSVDEKTPEDRQRRLAEHISLCSMQGVLAAEYFAAMPSIYYSSEYGRNCSLGITGYMRICHPTSNYPDLMAQRIIKSWIKSDKTVSNIDTNRHNRVIAALLPTFNRKLRLIEQAQQSLIDDDIALLLKRDEIDAYYIGGGSLLLPCGAYGTLENDRETPLLSKIKVKAVDEHKMIFCFT